MIAGRDVVVTQREVTGRNVLGEPVYTELDPVTVPDVLIVPGAAAELDMERPEGVRVAYTLHWPKAALGTVQLRDALIALSGEHEGTYRVIGDPKPYQSEICPTRWCMPVEVEAVDG